MTLGALVGLLGHQHLRKNAVGGGGLSAHPFRYPAAFKDLAPPKWVKFSIKLSLGWVTEVGLLRQVWEGIL